MVIADYKKHLGNKFPLAEVKCNPANQNLWNGWDYLLSITVHKNDEWKEFNCLVRENFDVLVTLDWESEITNWLCPSAN